MTPTPTTHDHRITAPAWQILPLTRSCDPPGTTTPPDKKTRAPLTRRCDPPGTTTPPDKKTCAAATIRRFARTIRERSRPSAVAQA